MASGPVQLVCESTAPVAEKAASCPLKTHRLTGSSRDPRIVAGGELFPDSVVVDDDVIKKIESLTDFAPLHEPAALLGIKAFKKILPDVISVAVFDTSFHTTLPEVNYMYSLPYEYYQKFQVRKYGAHGTSYRYVSARAAEILGKPLKDLKLIVLHLGAGASIDAIKDGKSFDTSMGFSPVAGTCRHFQPLREYHGFPPNF